MTNQNGSAPEHVQREDADAFEEEGDEHRVLAADMVRHPAEERPRQTVQDAVERGGEGQRRHGQADSSVTGIAVDLQVLRDRRQVGGDDQTAGADDART